MTSNEIKAAIMADTLAKRGGVYTARWGFFYRHGGTSEQHAGYVRALPGATVLEHGEVWKAFSGGAPLARQSHWWVTFTVQGGA